MNPKQLRKHLRKKNFRPGPIVRNNPDIPSLMDQVIPKPVSLMEKSSLLKKDAAASSSKTSTSSKKSPSKSNLPPSTSFSLMYTYLCFTCHVPRGVNGVQVQLN